LPIPNCQVIGREGDERGSIGGRKISKESPLFFRQGKAEAKESRASSAEVKPDPGKKNRLMIPKESPSRPITGIKDFLRPGIQGASFGSIRRWLFHG